MLTFVNLIFFLSPQAFPFDPNPDWSRFYSSGPEIWEYMKKTVAKWNLDRDVRFDHRVVGAQWMEHQAQWKVTIRHNDIETIEYADVLISGQGFLKCVSRCHKSVGNEGLTVEN